MEECEEFINIRKEARHFKTMERQKQRIDRLCHKDSIGKGIGKGGHSNMHVDHTVISMNTGSDTSIYTNTTSKWVINISGKPLTKAQETLLAHGPNFAVIPRSPPIAEYGAVMEPVCSRLKQDEADELRGEVKMLIKKTYNPPPNITKDERKAITELKKDSTRMILTADMGVSLVVMDTEEYKRRQRNSYNNQHTSPFPLIPQPHKRTNSSTC